MTAELTPPLNPVEPDLARLIYLRRHAELCKVVDELLAELGWQEVITLFCRVAQRKDMGHLQLTYHDVYYIPPGLLRDALLSILDMPVDIDGDLLRMFGRFKAHSLSELRGKVMRKAPKVLRTQIENGNTYFIRGEALRKTPLEQLIPLIDDQRREEVLALDTRPTHDDILRTYYGYALVTGQITPEEQGILDDLLNGQLKTRTKCPSFLPSTFHQCSEHLGRLLLNCMRLVVARPQTQARAAVELGNLADSRSLPVLHDQLKKSEDNPVIWRVMCALSAIGHSSSFDHLRPFVKHHELGSHVLTALAGVNHPDAVNVLLEYTNSKDHRRRNAARDSLWATHDIRAAEALINLMERGDCSGNLRLKDLARVGKAALPIVMENLSVIESVVKEHDWGHMQKLVRHIPELMEREEFFELVLRLIGDSRDGLTCRGILRDYPALLQRPAVKEAILRALKSSSRPVLVIADVYKMGLLKDQFEEEAKARVPDAAARIRGTAEPRVSFDMWDICKVPLLYDSEMIHDAIADAIKDGASTESILSAIKNHEGLSRNTGIQDAVVDYLRWGIDSTHSLQQVTKNATVMGEVRVQVAVAKVLMRHWADRENARRCRGVDWDSAEYDFVYVLYDLAAYPEMAQIEEFQQAVASLLKNAEYKSSVLQCIEPFPGILESQPLEEAIERVLGSLSSSYDFQKIRNHLSEKYHARIDQKIAELRESESLWYRRQSHTTSDYERDDDYYSDTYYDY